MWDDTPASLQKPLAREPWGVVTRIYNLQLRDLIIAGRAKPGKIVTQRLSLSQAPDAFRKFDERIDGYIKVVLEPNS